MFISGQNNVYGNRANERVFGLKNLKKPEKEDKSITEKILEESQGQKEDRVEISPEGRLAVGQEKEIQELTAEQEKEAQELAESGTEENEEEGISEESGGKAAVNEGKRMRQIMAAKSRGQLQQVLALLQKDLSDCKAGLEKGWCDESEIAKVEALMNRAKSRMSEVPQEAEQEGGLDEFAMASLM